LSREIWGNLKKKATSKGGSIKCCVKSGVQSQGPVGVFACDEEAYKTFSDLFGPIIKDLHPKFDFRYSYKYEDFKLDSFTTKLATMQE
jgi:creatine kinase/arginine kinase